MRFSALPRPLRLALFAAATAVVLYFCLAPDTAMPKVPLWDKLEHALAWGVLTALGVILSPRRWMAIALFAVALGAGVEILQMTLGFGREGDWRDFLADCAGVLIALRLLQAKRAFDHRRRPRAGDSEP